MSICEGCIKQDVCKFKKEIDHWDKEGFFYGNKNVPKPLKVDIYCELRVVTEPSYWTYTSPAVSIPSVWTDPWTTVTWGGTTQPATSSTVYLKGDEQISYTNVN